MFWVEKLLRTCFSHGVVNGSRSVCKPEGRARKGSQLSKYQPKVPSAKVKRKFKPPVFGKDAQEDKKDTQTVAPPAPARFSRREVRFGWHDASVRPLLLGHARQPCAKKKRTGHLRVARYCALKRGFVFEGNSIRPAGAYAVVDLRWP